MKENLAPPMGWNSWDCFGTSVTEAEVLANADFMAKHLLAFGWDTVVIDIQWSEPAARAGGYNDFAALVMDDYGRLLPAVNRFPSAAADNGFKPIASRIHDLGLKFGIHIMRGIPRRAVENNLPIKNSAYTAQDAANTQDTCPWNTDMFGLNMAHPAAQDYYDSIFELYATWDVDFIKADDMLYPYHTEEIAGFRRAMARCGREMILSLSPGVDVPVDKVDHLRTNCDMWRISPDFWDIWDDLKRQFDLCREWGPYLMQGAYPDADMLPLGHISLRGERGEDRQSRFTRTEVMTMLTLWSIFRSPLMLGCDLPTTDSDTIALLTNADVIKVNQHSKNNRELFHRDDAVAWIAESTENEDRYLALFNIGERDLAIRVELADIGWDVDGCRQWDIWAGTDRGIHEHAITAVVPPHGAVFYRLSPLA